jgi:hypothetical protein
MADQSLTDTLKYLGDISARMGQGRLDETYTTDLSALKIAIAYFNKILAALGQGQVTDTSTDELSALSIIAWCLSKFAKAMS